MFATFKDWLARQRQRLFPIRNIVAVVTTAPANYPLTRAVLAQHLAEQLHREYSIPGLCAADIRGLRKVNQWPKRNVFRCHIRRALARDWELLRGDLEVTVYRELPEEWAEHIPAERIRERYQRIRGRHSHAQRPADDPLLVAEILSELKFAFDGSHPRLRQIQRVQVWHGDQPEEERVCITVTWDYTPVDLNFTYHP